MTINYEAAQLCIQLYQPQNAALQYIIQNLVGFLDPFLLLFIIPLINFVAPHFLCFMSMSLRFRVGVGYLVILMAAVSLIFTEGLPIPGHGHLLCLLLPLMLLVVAEALSVISGILHCCFIRNTQICIQCHLICSASVSKHKVINAFFHFTNVWL